MMKKFFLIACFISFNLINASAQTDERAKAILTEVSKKYRSYNVVRAEFTYAISGPDIKTPVTNTGTIYVQSKTNKYRVIFKDQELISDGISQWTHLKDDKEVQLNSVSNKPDALNPAQIFTIYEKGFKYLYVGETKVKARAVQTIDLSPGDIKKSYFKVRLSIDKLNKQITNVVIFDKNGSKFTYNIKSLTSAVKIGADFFTFDPKKYPGIEVVDLR